MNSGWPTQRLGELCEIVKGRKPTLKSTPSTGDLPYLVAKVLRGTQDPEFASTTDRNSVVVSEEETIIICDGSNSGEVFTGYRGILSSTMGKIIPKADMDGAYLRVFLDSTFDVFNDSKTGAAIPHLDKEALYALSLSYPPVVEQRRIVTILDEAFETIATAKANAEKNLRNVRELWNKQLDTFFATKNSSWRETTLEAVLHDQPRNGWSPPAANHSDSGTPVLTLSAVTGFFFREDKIKFTSAETNPNAHYWVKNGDLLLTRSNTPSLVGHVAIAEGLIEPTIYPDLIMRMTPDPSLVECKFLYYQLRTAYLREIITSRAQGANPTMVKLNKSSVQSLPISVPSLDVQRQIIDELENLADQTQTLATSNHPPAKPGAFGM